MATTQDTLPVRVDVFDRQGKKVRDRFLGCLRRDHAIAVAPRETAPAPRGPVANPGGWWAFCSAATAADSVPC